MTHELARALHFREPPFHGTTFNVEELDMNQLWECYRASARVLIKRSPTELLLQNADWHWHDGYMNDEHPLTREEWIGWLQSPESLAAAWCAEDQVHRAVYPPSRQWMIRFYLWERPGESLLNQTDCGIDVSGDPELIDQIQSTVTNIGGFKTELRNSKEWFESSGDTWWDPESEPV